MTTFKDFRVFFSEITLSRLLMSSPLTIPLMKKNFVFLYKMLNFYSTCLYFMVLLYIVALIYYLSNESIYIYIYIYTH